MKNTIYIICILIASFTTVQAQHSNNKQKWDKIDALKHEFILKKLDLSSHKSEQFIPVYKAYQKELRSLFQARRQFREANKNNPEKQIEVDFNMEAKQLELKRKYKDQFDTILSPEELKTLYSSERQFREELIKQLNQK